MVEHDNRSHRSSLWSVAMGPAKFAKWRLLNFFLFNFSLTLVENKREARLKAHKNED